MDTNYPVLNSRQFFRRTRNLLVLLIVILIPFSSARAASETLGAIEKRGKVIARSAIYGVAGGLVVGLASQVVKPKVKNIFVGGSLGLYAGIIMGIYLTSTARDNMNYEGPDTYEDYGDFSKTTPRLEQKSTRGVLFSEKLELNLVSLSF